MLNRLKQSTPYCLFQKYSADEAANQAILIAWTGLLAMFPLVLALHALIGLVVRDPEVWATVEQTIVGTFPGRAADEVREVLATAREGAAARGIIGLVGLLFSGSALFGTMAHAFNHAYRVPGRGLVGQRVMAMGMIVLFSVLMVVSLLASAAANFVLAAVQGVLPVQIPGWGTLLTLSALGLSLLTAFVLFLAIYRVVPNAGQRLSEVWPGALLAAVLFFLLGQVFPLYARFSGGFGQYAAFGLFFLVMMWFYFLAQILMVGVELNAFLSRPVLREARPQPAVARGAEGEDASARQAGGRHAPAVRRPGVVKRFLYAGLTAIVSWVVLALARLAVRA